MKKVAINICYGGFSLSNMAYEKLIEWGIPVCNYKEPKRNENGLYEKETDDEVIYDRELTLLGEDESNDKLYHFYKDADNSLFGRYWDTWTRENRTHPLVIRVIEELGEAANGRCAELKVVEIPDNVEYYIDEYDGIEHVAEKHRTWG